MLRVGALGLVLLLGAPSAAAQRRPAGAWERWWEAHRALFFGERRGALEPALRERVERRLRAMLSDRDDEARLQAALALGKIGGRKIGAALAEAVQRETRKQTRTGLLLALGLSGSHEQRGLLRHHLLDQRARPLERHCAAIGLGWLGDDADVELLARLLDDRRADRSIQLGALLGLSRIKSVRAVALAGRVLADRRRHKLLRILAAHALARQEPREALPRFAALIEGSKREDGEVAQAAALALGSLRGPETCKLLRRLASRSRASKTWAFVVLSLARQRDPTQSTLLRGLLVDGPRSLRAHCALACGIQGASGMRGALRRYCADHASDPSALAAGVLALGLMRDRHLLDQVLSPARWRSRGRSPEFVAHAAVAFGLLRDRRAVELLRPAWRQHRRHRDLRALGASALLRCGDEGAADELRRVAAGKRSSADRIAAIAALGEIGDRAAVADLLTAASDRDADVRAAGAAAIGVLLDRQPKVGAMQELSLAFDQDVADLNRSLRFVFSLR